MSRSEDPAGAECPQDAAVYTRTFWLAYLANFALITANALMFRFAELVAFLGGSERAAGAIVGMGLFVALVLRLTLGQGIDRYGTRAAWVISSLLLIAGCATTLLCHRVSLGLYAARALYAIGLAGTVTCSIVQVQNMVPVHRRTEAIEALGTSGFLGMIAGAYLGDWIFAVFPPSEARFVVLFGAAAGLGVFYLAVVFFLTRRDLHVPPHRPAPTFTLLVHYWPGSVLLVAITLGMGLGVTTVFLTRFATELHLPRIRSFFATYAFVGLLFRFRTTQWARTIGRHRTILLGLTGNIVGHASLPWVTQEWHFLFPAVACGFGHALLYPAIVSLGSGSFPRVYRGLATTFVLGCTELGTAVSPPVLGWIIDHYGYSQMFYSAAGFGVAVAVYYALTTAHRPDHDYDPEPEVLFSGKAGSNAPAADAISAN